jgi:hypothetical protein
VSRDTNQTIPKEYGRDHAATRIALHVTTKLQRAQRRRA